MENIQPKNKSTFLVLLAVIGWAIAIVFALTSLFFWQQNDKLRGLLLTSENLQSQLVSENEQLMRRMSNEAVIIDEKMEPYTFQNFGLYSPLFENQDVLTLTYDYKGNTITQKHISPSESENDVPPWTISVWEVLPQNNFEVLDSLKYGNTPNFPIFDGYEWQLTNPQVIEDRVGLWEENQDFTNENQIKMHPGFIMNPRSIAGTKYEFINQFSPTGNPSFVVIGNYIEGFAQQSYEQPVVEARNKLNEIVNTIDFRLPDDRENRVTQ